MTRRRTSLLAASLLLCAAPALHAQEAPPPAPAASADEGGISLVYKYKIGNVQRFRTENVGNLSVTPEGAGGLGPIPFVMKNSTLYTEKVTGTRQGTGTLSMQLDTVTTSYNVMGRSSVIKYANGKTTTTVNGQPQAAVGGAAETAALAQVRKAVVIHKDPRGNISLVSKTSPGMAQPGVGGMLGGVNVSVMVLPDKPVKVGDTWETTQSITPNIPVPNGGASAIPVVEVKFTHTLRSLAKKNGKTFAMIDSVGSGASPEGAPGGSISENFTGATRFDIARGAIASGKYNIDMAIKLPAALFGITPPAGAGANGTAAPALRIDGTMELTLTEAPAGAAQAKGAARKKRR